MHIPRARIRTCINFILAGSTADCMDTNSLSVKAFHIHLRVRHDCGMVEAFADGFCFGPIMQCKNKLASKLELPIIFYNRQSGEFVVCGALCRWTRSSDSSDRRQRGQQTQNKMGRFRKFVVSGAISAGSLGYLDLHDELVEFHIHREALLMDEDVDADIIALSS